VQKYGKLTVGGQNVIGSQEGIGGGVKMPWTVGANWMEALKLP